MYKYVCFQVKIWFQNRRMKWKRSKKASSEAKAKPQDKPKSSVSEHTQESAQSKPEEDKISPVILSGELGPSAQPTVGDKETNNNGHLDATGLVSSTDTIEHENMDPVQHVMGLEGPEISQALYPDTEEDSVDADNRIINVTGWDDGGGGDNL